MTRKKARSRTRSFSGRHMLFLMLAFFGTIIAVNLTMAVLATRTFGGTVVDNGYVASQKYNAWLAAAREQERLGGAAEARLADDRHVLISLTQAERPLDAAGVEAVLSHPLGRAADVRLAFEPAGPGLWRSDRPVAAGRWQVRITVSRGDRQLRFIESLA